jgi:hypothetical protein
MGLLGISDLLAHLPAILIALGVPTLVGCALGRVYPQQARKNDLLHRVVYGAIRP